MILLTLGSQKFQFNRLLKKVDKLIEEGIIKEDVYAQIGFSDYKPKHFEYVDFLNQDDFQKIIEKCDYVITHAGTGAILSSIKKGKKVIAIPRLKQYGEHVDDHQIQLINEFENLKLIEACYDINKLEEAIENIKTKEYDIYKSNTDSIIKSIDSFLKSF